MILAGRLSQQASAGACARAARLSAPAHRRAGSFAARHVAGRPERLHLFTARAGRSLFGTCFSPGDFLVFGQEQLGLPPALVAAWPDRCLSIPMLPGQRSLNLAVAAGVGVYGALASLSV
jgi:tRNA (cytidine/uridine-2'-O-)-methyltransferase